MTDLIGTTIGNYVTTALLGSGGMGQVYRAEHPEIGRQVAIKVVSGDFAAHPVVIGRFRSEAQAVNKIGHPNIVDISDFGTLPDGRPYFVMELLEGEDLKSRLRSRGRLSEAEATPILAQILDALAAAHAAGIIHRDIKPDNIFLAQRRGEEVVKLLDFGIAKLREEGAVGATLDGQLLGTPLYMSPEQAVGRAADVGPASDIYSLGVVMYQLFTGSTPFRGDTFGALVLMHAHEEPAPPSRVVAIDPRLEAVIMRCLKKEPQDRFSSVELLRAALAVPLPGLAPRAPGTAQQLTLQQLTSPYAAPAPAIQKPAAFGKKLLWVLVGGLALGVVGGAIGLRIFGHHGPSPLAPSALAAPAWPGPILDGKELP